MVSRRPEEEGNSSGAPVRAQLLGSFAIQLGEKTAGPWPRLSAKRLCALVLLSPKRRVAREAAGDTLFGDIAPRASANALRNALSAARAVLGELGPAAGLLRTDRTHMYVPSDVPLEVDLEQHEAALRDAVRLPPGDERDAALSLALSERGVLLEDQPYEEWSLRPRRARAGPSGGPPGSGPGPFTRFWPRQPGALSEAWEAVLAADATSEEAATALMGTYVAHGQRHLVARAYQRCRDGLKGARARTVGVARDRLPGCDVRRGNCGSIAPGGDGQRNQQFAQSLSSFIGRDTELAEVCPSCAPQR